MLDTSGVKKLARIRSCPGPPLAARFEVLVSPTRPRTMITASGSLPGQGVGFLDVRVANAICRSNHQRTNLTRGEWLNVVRSYASLTLLLLLLPTACGDGKWRVAHPATITQEVTVTVRWTNPLRCVLTVQHEGIDADNKQQVSRRSLVSKRRERRQSPAVLYEFEWNGLCPPHHAGTPRKRHG